MTTQRCQVCKTKTVAHWIPLDMRDKSAGSIPVCSSSRCVYVAWTIPTPKKMISK